MKLAPTNFPGRAIVATQSKDSKQGMTQQISFGYANDVKAMSVFAEGGYLHNANIFYSVLSGKGYKTREANFSRKHSGFEH